MKRRGSIWVATCLTILVGGLISNLFRPLENMSHSGESMVPRIPPRLAADAPIKVFNDSAWASVPGITGTGEIWNPYVIADKTIDGGDVDVGIWIENTTKTFIIRNCSVTGGLFPYGGIYIANVSNAIIDGNNCSGNAVGIQLDRQCRNITIQYNNAAGNDWHGIIIYNNSSGVLVKRNNASGNTASGILISTQSYANTVEQNNVSGNGNRGISLVQTSSWNNISLNNCLGNTWYGIGLDSSSANNTVIGNLVANGLHDGINIKNALNNTFIHNTAAGNAGAGIFLEGTSANNTVMDNTFANNIDGIYLTASAKNNTFTRNNMTQNANYGANLTVGADGNWLISNNFSENVAGQGWDTGAYNHWDNGSAGNFWSDYAGVDADDDLAGDTPYTIGGPASAKDNHPFCDDGNDLVPVILTTGLPAFAGTAAPVFTLNLVETYLDEIWVSYDGGATNHSCGVAGTLPQWSALGNDTFTITFFANDTDDYVGTITILLHKDIIAPTLTIPSPTSGTSFSNAPMFTVTVEDAQLEATWYTIGSDATRHYFTGTSFTIDAEAWAAFPKGEIVIHIYASDTLGNVRTILVTIIKANDIGWLWIVVIGSIVAVMLVIVVLRKNKMKRKHD